MLCPSPNAGTPGAWTVTFQTPARKSKHQEIMLKERLNRATVPFGHSGFSMLLFKRQQEWSKDGFLPDNPAWDEAGVCLGSGKCPLFSLMGETYKNTETF